MKITSRLPEEGVLSCQVEHLSEELFKEGAEVSRRRRPERRLTDEEIAKLKEIVWKLSEEIADDMGVELIDVTYRKEGRRWVLRITINRPGGTSLRDCELFSRSLEWYLDDMDLIPHSYYLEVQSKGID